MADNREDFEVGVNPSSAIQGILSIGGAMKNIYGIAAGVAAAFASWKITQATFQSMTTAENQIIRLKTALQDATKGIQDYEQAMKFAAKTPFPVEQVIQASVMLRTFQFNPFEQVEKGGRQLLEVLGDMAGSTGQSVETATWALTRAMVGEWEIMQNNFQISARMIPKLAGLRTGTKEYGAAIVEFMTKQDRFRGGMDLTAKSLSGMMSNMSDAIDLIFMGIGGVADSEQKLKGLTLFDSVKQSFKGLYDAVSADSPLKTMMSLQAQMQGAKPGSEMAKSLKDQYENLVKLNPFLEDYARALDTAEGKAAKTEGEKLNFLLTKQGALANDLLSQGEKLIMLGRQIGQVFKAVFDAVIAPIFTGLSKMIEFSLNQVADIGNAIVPLEAFSKKTETTMENVSEHIKDALNKSAGSAFLTTKQFADLGSAYVNTVSEADKNAIEKRFLASKSVLEKQFLIFAIIMKIIVASAQKSVMQFLTWFNDKFPGVGAQIVNFFEGIWNLVKNVIKSTFTLLGGIFDGLAGDWESILGDLASAFVALMDPINEIIKLLNLAFGDDNQDALKLMGYLIGKVIGTALKVVAYLLKVVANIIGGIVSLILSAINLFVEWPKTLESINGIWESMINIAIRVGKAIREFISDPIGALYSGVKKVMGALSDLAGMSGTSIGVGDAPDWLPATGVGGQDMIRTDPNSNSIVEKRISNGVSYYREAQNKNSLQERNFVHEKYWSGHKFAKGSYEIPNDMIAQLHKGEIVLPESIANVIRTGFGRQETSSSGGRPIQIVQHFYGGTANSGKFKSEMKSSARELARQLELMEP